MLDDFADEHLEIFPQTAGINYGVPTEGPGGYRLARTGSRCFGFALRRGRSRGALEPQPFGLLAKRPFLAN